jgi:putative ABC transport system substrate-binding protein
LKQAGRTLIIHLASERRLPLGMHTRKWVEQGALFSYASDFAAICRAAATCVDKILKGTSPADLPVDLMSQLELVINLKTAEMIGITIPPIVLYQATTVIR